MYERHTVVERDDSGSGVATGMVLAIVAVLLIGVAALFLFFGGPGRFIGGTATTPSSNTTNVNVPPPSQPQPAPNINVQPPAQSAPNINVQPPAQPNVNINPPAQQAPERTNPSGSNSSSGSNSTNPGGTGTR